MLGKFYITFLTERLLRKLQVNKIKTTNLTKITKLLIHFPEMWMKRLIHIWDMLKTCLGPVCDLFKTFHKLTNGKQTNILTRKHTNRHFQGQK